MRFERISIEDGALDLARSRDRPTLCLHQYLPRCRSLVPLAGHSRPTGDSPLPAQRARSTWPPASSHGDRQRFKLVVDENKQHPSADLDADLIFATIPWPRPLPSIDGQMKLSGHVNGAIALPWQLSGNVEGGLRNATLGRSRSAASAMKSMRWSFAGAANLISAQRRASMRRSRRIEIDLDRLLTAQGAAPGDAETRASARAVSCNPNDLDEFRRPIRARLVGRFRDLGGETLSGLSGGFAIAARKSAFALRFEAGRTRPFASELRGQISRRAMRPVSRAMSKRAPTMSRGSAQWLATNLPQTAPLARAIVAHVLRHFPAKPICRLWASSAEFVAAARSIAAAGHFGLYAIRGGRAGAPLRRSFRHAPRPVPNAGSVAPRAPREGHGPVAAPRCAGREDRRVSAKAVSTPGASNCDWKRRAGSPSSTSSP